MADIERDEGNVAPPDVIKEQERIGRADAICLVFPLFWWGMPSMTKGWIDRVWSWGWAYDQLDNPEKSLQRPRSGVLLIPAGARSDEIENEGYLAAMETAWTKGTFGYFGFSPRKLELGRNSIFNRTKARFDRVHVCFLLFCYRCGPCNRIAPVVQQFAVKYPRAVFLKVDVDKCTV